MNSFTIGMAALAAGMTACGAAGTALAAPSDAMLEVYAAITDQGLLLDRLDLVPGASLAAGETVVLNTLDAAYGSSVRVSYDVETIGTERTIRLTYTTLGDRFVTEAAYDAMTSDSNSQRAALGFSFGFFSDSMETAERSRTYRYGLEADGGSVLDFGPQGWGDSEDQSLDGIYFSGFDFLGTDGTPIDTFFYEMTYRIVPAPGAAAVLAVGGLGVARRRRR